MCLNSRRKSQLVRDFAASKRAIKENENAETFQQQQQQQQQQQSFIRLQVGNH